MDKREMSNESQEEKERVSVANYDTDVHSGRGVKGIIRRFLPASRVYIDNRMKKMDSRIEKELQLLKEEKQILKEQKQMLADQKKTIDFHLLLSRELQKNGNDVLKAVDDIKKYVDQEFRRRDEWQLRETENRLIAGESSIWVIKCPAPEGDSKVAWGNYPFAMSLKKELEKLNIYVVVQTWQDWGCEEGADVVIVLRGSHPYRPDRRNKKCLYIMWNISHPDKVSEEEYQLYDVVCVGSKHYAQQLQNKLTVPVLPLLQCTDTDLFYPAQNADTSICQKNYIFIGNSRGVERSSVMYAVKNELPLSIWGGGWNRILEGHTDLIQDTFIENSEIPELYRTSKVSLNDHWQDMLDYQFVNNRIFDALACGLPVISDVSDELKEIFPDAVLYYRNEEEFRACAEKIKNDYEEVKEKVLAQWPLIQAQYSFRTRAQQLKEIADQYHQASDDRKAGNNCKE